MSLYYIIIKSEKNNSFWCFRELVGTIGWAKQVPGFAHLSLSDQMNLLHGCWLEVLLLAVAQRSAVGGRASLNDQIKVI